MLTNISEAISLSRDYSIPSDDVLFIDLSLTGVSFSFPHVRIRFEFFPEDEVCFRNSIERGVENYFFALPVSSDSLYRIEDNKLMMDGRVLGSVRNVKEDTCDSSYLRRKGTVFVFNPVSKSSCNGCKFCHTVKQTPKDRTSLLKGYEVRSFIEGWMTQNSFSDLSHLVQVSIVTGCFGNERRVVDYLKMIKTLLNELGFSGEILYYGSEITSKEGLDELKALTPLTICFSVECFNERNMMLKYTKGTLSLDQIANILWRAKGNGCKTRFSYVLGIESLEAMELGFKSLFSCIDRFPVVNIFQFHEGQENLRFCDAKRIDYYLQARKSIERMFVDTDMRPAPWENYRSLWHLNFGKEELNEIRTPS